MENDTNKIINDQLNSLPKALQDAILKSGWEKKAHDLAKKHQLHIDQEGDLVNETFLVLLGLELSKDFQQNLVDNIHVNKETAEALVNEIGAEIFAPIREHLQNIEDSEEEPEEKTEEPAEILNREDILKEIENPTENKNPVITTPSVAQTPNTLPVVPETKDVSITPTFETEPIIKIPETPKTPDIIEQKLASVTHQPAEKIEVPVKKPLIDPYREPIN